MLAEMLVSAMHVANDDRQMLKPAIVTSRIDRDRSPFISQKFGEFDRLIAQLQLDYAEVNFAGGIQAMYFRDPDGHNLELIHFPVGKGEIGRAHV